ncbi:MAG: hypothetical protein ACK55I_03425, partial [bacterium]
MVRVGRVRGGGPEMDRCRLRGLALGACALVRLAPGLHADDGNGLRAGGLGIAGSSDGIRSRLAGLRAAGQCCRRRGDGAGAQGHCASA